MRMASPVMAMSQRTNTGTSSSVPSSSVADSPEYVPSGILAISARTARSMRSIIWSTQANTVSTPYFSTSRWIRFSQVCVAAMRE